MTTLDPLATCTPCGKKGIGRAATYTIELWDGSLLPVCDTCKAAFPLPLLSGMNAVRELPGAASARRLSGRDHL